MGNFYTNTTIQHGDAAAVAATLRQMGRDAYVMPESGMTVAFDRECDAQDPAAIATVSETLSRTLNAVALTVLNHDDDILLYLLYEDGRKLDEYESRPGYFEGAIRPPSGGDAKLLCERFGHPDRQSDVDRVLRSPSEYVFALQQHQELVEILGLPTRAVALGYTYIANGDYPKDFAVGALIRVGGAP
jgi:hypothetical protein